MILIRRVKLFRSMNETSKMNSSKNDSELQSDYRRTKNKHHKCEICEKELSSNAALKRHFDSVHLKMKIYECDICNQRFGTAWSLKAHIINVHTVKRNHKCDSCGKLFSQALYLKSHIQKGCKCNFCGKLFSEGGILKKHIQKVHEGRRDYKCELCKKSYSTNTL